MGDTIVRGETESPAAVGTILVTDQAARGRLASHRTTPEVLRDMRGALLESTGSQSALTSVPGEVLF